MVLDSDDIKDMSLIGRRVKKYSDSFSDIKDIFEKLTPMVVFILNRYFKRMVKVIEENHGRVDNYIGDGMVAILESMMKNLGTCWKAAIDMRDEMDDMKPYLKTMYGKDFDIGIGVHWGECCCWRYRGRRIKRFTAIGDSMNFASRVESANKQFKSGF